MGFNTSAEVLNALALVPKGKARAEILSDNANRTLVLNSGAGFTMYCGEPKAGATFRERLSDIHVAVISRRNAKTGAPDGLGGLGGLAERTNPLDFYKMSLEERASLVGIRDDVILEKGKVVLTKDINIICKNNMLREAREELNDLNIQDINFKDKSFEPVDLTGFKDDNFITNIWDGQGVAYAVNPYYHLLKVETDFITNLTQCDNGCCKADAELTAIRKLPLFNMLSRFGRCGGAHRAEDGRDMQHDYRYPQEWLMTWAIASKALGRNPEKMVGLAREVQLSAGHPLNFAAAAKRGLADASLFAKAMGIDNKTIKRMQDTMNMAYIKKAYARNICYRK